MIVLAGGDIVQPDGVRAGGSLLIEDGEIAGIEAGVVRPAGAEIRSVAGHRIVPGFIDVHVHGVDGIDVLDGPDAVGAVAARLPRYGVTAFCPTSVACTPETLAVFLDSVARARSRPLADAAAVLPAHLESNFINPAWSGAQPVDCLRRHQAPGPDAAHGAFTGDDVLRVMRATRAQIAVVTLAPELPGGLELVRLIRDEGHVVSIGHSGATYLEALEAIRCGVTHATHLFNRMTPLTHREPGIVGAVLDSPAVAAEIICDGYHVHPRVIALAVRAKSAARTIAITDGTAAAGLPAGGRARLGGRTIIAGPRFATLEDGTLAGSIVTMDRAFRTLVNQVGLTLEEASRLCSTTPADQLGLRDRGRLAVGARADLVVLGRGLDVVETWMAGRPVGEHG
jgi:N-acetylglucosamine-6-phosphate deacetylase